MPMFKRADAEIHYTSHGSGFPILLYAPGGLKSQMEMWGGESAAYPNGFPWMDPREALADKYTVVAMDQRNAGKSIADVKPDHGWHTFADDHFALMDHLGFGKFHVMGGCIGGSYCFEAIEHDPDAHRRGGAAEPDRPVGEPRHLGRRGQGLQRDGARARSRRSARRPSSRSATTCSATDFVFSVTRDFVKDCQHAAVPPARHRQAASGQDQRGDRRARAQHRGPEGLGAPAHLQESIQRVRAFLEKNTPA